MIKSKDRRNGWQTDKKVEQNLTYSGNSENRRSGKKNDIWQNKWRRWKDRIPWNSKRPHSQFIRKLIPSTRRKGITQTMDCNNTTTSKQHMQHTQHKPHNLWSNLGWITKQFNNQKAEEQQSHRPRPNTKWNLHIKMKQIYKKNINIIQTSNIPKQWLDGEIISDYIWMNALFVITTYNK